LAINREELQVAEPAIAACGLTRKFGEVVALSDLNLRVPEGSVHGIIGLPGSGKSTSINLMLGLLEPTSGSVLVLGHDPLVAGEHIRSHIGVLLEPCGLYERLSAWDNLDYYGRIWHMPAAERNARAEELLTTFGIWDRRNDTVADWGACLRKQLCIARSLMHRPELVLLDEPCRDLDSAASQVIATYLCTLAEQTGTSIVMATNNFDIAEICCLDITILQNGCVLTSGRMDQVRSLAKEPTIEIVGRGFTDDVVTLLLRRPEVTFAKYLDHRLDVRLAAHVDTKPLVSLLVESGVEINDVRKPNCTLSEAFCALSDRSASEVHTVDASEMEQ
jgi:ABC-2 type transport system ATP-binding protein